VNGLETVVELSGIDMALSELFAVQPESGDTAEMVCRPARP